MARRRRKRFLFTGQPPRSQGVRKNLDVLAYDLQGATACAMQAGWTNLRVREDENKSIVQARREGRRAIRVDHRALHEACELLGLNKPVQIVMVGHAKTRKGAYRSYPEKHHITLDKWQTVESGTHTLWHELTHAMQEERMGHVQWGLTARHAPKPSRATGSYERYKADPIETEANRNADQYAAIHPLVR